MLADTSLMKLERQLKILLRDHDVTVAQLARKVGLSSKTIYNWLKGQQPRDIGAVKRVADEFGVTLDYICYGLEKRDNHRIERHLDDIHCGVFEVILRKPTVTN